MKQQILNLKIKLLLAEIGGKLSDEFVQIMNEYGTAEILGKLTDITESQYQQWVDKFNNGAYRNYKDEYPFYPDFDTDNFFLTAKESFFSYLESQEILFSNPYEEPIVPTDEENAMALELLRQWQEAEEKVWVLSNCYLFSNNSIIYKTTYGTS